MATLIFHVNLFSLSCGIATKNCVVPTLVFLCTTILKKFLAKMLQDYYLLCGVIFRTYMYKIESSLLFSKCILKTIFSEISVTILKNMMLKFRQNLLQNIFSHSDF